MSSNPGQGKAWLGLNSAGMSARILVVDDTPASRQTIEGMLFKEGYDLDFAESGWECLDFLESAKPDLILLDVMMPGMSGFDVCRRVKSCREYSAIPIILLTALNKKEDLLKGLESGADEFVSKPVSAPELRARVRNLLRLKRLHDELEQTLEFRQDLTRFLVHDMRNPLISIRLSCELGQLDTTDERALEAFRKVLGEVKTLQGYIDEMLIAATLEGSQFELDLTPISGERFVRDWLAGQAQWKAKDIEFRDHSGGATLTCDEPLLKRVLENLVGNAVKYGADSQVVLSLEVDEESLRFNVADLGPGIPDAHKETIWEKHGIVPLRKAGVRQTGLGLYFCRLVAEAHGGSIAVSDNVPQGALFTLTLPRQSGTE
jgi:two-component system, sensor histidine kinase and response regulator